MGRRLPLVALFVAVQILHKRGSSPRTARKLRAYVTSELCLTQLRSSRSCGVALTTIFVLSSKLGFICYQDHRYIQQRVSPTEDSVGDVHCQRIPTQSLSSSLFFQDLRIDHHAMGKVVASP